MHRGEKHAMPTILLTLLVCMTPGVFAASEVRLIGEEEVTDVQDYASRLLEEAAVFFDSAPSDWDFVGAYDRGLQVFSRPVEGSGVSYIPFFSQEVRSL